MRRIRACLSLGLLLLSPALVAAQDVGEKNLVEKDLAVHEWGVFRVHTDSDVANGDLLREWNDLPEFVYGQINGRRIPQHYGAVEIRRRPVIFFHSARPLEVQMKIDFPGGMARVWWPSPLSPAREGEQRVKLSTSLLWQLGIKQPPKGKVPKTPAPPPVEKGHWIEQLRGVKCAEGFDKY